ncbi:MAG: ABC transporter permease [Burkholderiaceae bacterium]|nr:ABC transporter permease [Burkholderiaceae bacterium]
MALIAAAGAGHAQAQLSPQFCGSLENAYGPFEYRFDRFKPAPDDREPHQAKRRIVEDNHFTPEVEALIRGKTSTTPQHDLDYTLRAFPNHHRALATLMRLWERGRSPQPGDLPRPVECYFERAVRFQPDDTTARLLYATFLHKDKRKPEALQQLERARFHAGDNGFTHYNIGLVFLDVGEPEQALAQAHRAMDLGFERTGLKDKLVALGRWQDPAPPMPSSDAAPAPAPTK